jgi:hypothetical protein
MHRPVAHAVTPDHVLKRTQRSRLRCMPMRMRMPRRAALEAPLRAQWLEQSQTGARRSRAAAQRGAASPARVRNNNITIIKNDKI